MAEGNEELNVLVALRGQRSSYTRAISQEFSRQTPDPDHPLTTEKTSSHRSKKSKVMYVFIGFTCNPTSADDAIPLQTILPLVDSLLW
jgi:hypothetical protein